MAVTSPDFRAAQRYLNGNFAQAAILRLGEKEVPFPVAFDLVMNLFAAIERSEEINSDLIDLLQGNESDRNGEIRHAIVKGLQDTLLGAKSEYCDEGVATLLERMNISPDLFDESRTPFQGLVSAVEQTYEQILNQYALQGSSVASIQRACRSFWWHFDIKLDERGFPITWW